MKLLFAVLALALAAGPTLAADADSTTPTHSPSATWS